MFPSATHDLEKSADVAQLTTAAPDQIPTEKSLEILVAASYEHQAEELDNGYKEDDWETNASTLGIEIGNAEGGKIVRLTRRLGGWGVEARGVFYSPLFFSFSPLISLILNFCSSFQLMEFCFSPQSFFLCLLYENCNADHIISVSPFLYIDMKLQFGFTSTRAIGPRINFYFIAMWSPLHCGYNLYRSLLRQMSPVDFLPSVLFLNRVFVHRE